jgi:hypothetical protein
VIPNVSVPDTRLDTSIQKINDRGFINYDVATKLTDEEFENKTGVNRAFFEKMLVLLNKALPKVGKPPKLGLPDQLLLTLIFLREHINELDIALAYGISKNTAHRIILKNQGCTDEIGLISHGCCYGF